MAGDEQCQGEGGRQERAGEGREEERERRDQRQLDEDEEHGHEQARIGRGRLPGTASLDRLAPRQQGQHGVEDRGHHREVHEQRQQQPRVLAEDELRPPHGLREQGMHRAPVHLFRHQPDADEHGDEQPEQ